MGGRDPQAAECDHHDWPGCGSNGAASLCVGNTARDAAQASVSDPSIERTRRTSLTGLGVGWWVEGVQEK